MHDDDPGFGPTSAIRPTLAASAIERTHSAPERVLPNPRPALMTQIDQSPGGGSCSGRAIEAQSHRGNRRQVFSNRQVTTQSGPSGNDLGLIASASIAPYRGEAILFASSC